MDIKLNDHETNQILDDEYINISFGEYRIYLEFDRDKNPWYFEIIRSKNGRTVKGYANNTSDLDKLIPTRPNDPSYFHNDPLCPNCGTYMIYEFECCPKCGQKLDWSKE